MRRDMRGRINHVPQNVHEEECSSAELEGKRQERERDGESGDMGALMDENGVDLLLCRTTPTPVQLRSELN